MTRTASAKETPYSHKSSHQFWRTAIADIESKDITQIWKPKYPISTSSRILTVGSCFARHISNWFCENGFTFVDSEPAPPHLSEEDKSAGGYGSFSFRVGNVYTAAMLKQWIGWSLGAEACPSVSFEEEARHYDPFRPSIPRQGFDSFEAMQEARQVTFANIRRSLLEADTFVFTLGLTEAWVHHSGYVYAMCPGTVRGDYCDKEHSFKNFSFSEINRDLRETMAMVRGLNPAMRFLFTVSPVPLTATNTDQHVLPATTYSKSVLRAVAGELANTMDFVDYFPSYELISSPPFRGQFYGENLRTVKEHGVQFVMHNFKRSLEQSENTALETEMSMTATATINDKPARSDNTGDEFCDEGMLEVFNRSSTPNMAQAPHNLCVLGDSHMGFLSSALTAAGIAHSGGGIMNASAWRANSFAIDEQSFFLPYENIESQKKWHHVYESFFANRSLEGTVLLTNIGNHLHTVPFDLAENFRKNTEPGSNLAIDYSDLVNFTRFGAHKHLQLLEIFIKAGMEVIVVTDPPFQHAGNDTIAAGPELYQALESILIPQFESLGCKVFNARSWLDEIVTQNPKTGIEPFLATRTVEGKRDWLHGSDFYYASVAEQVLQLSRQYPSQHASTPVLAC